MTLNDYQSKLMNSYVTEEEITQAILSANKKPTTLPEADVRLLVFTLFIETDSGPCESGQNSPCQC